MMSWVGKGAFCAQRHSSRRLYGYGQIGSFTTRRVESYSRVEASPVGGRLRFFTRSWERFGSPWCVSIAQYGYTIPLISEPVIPMGLPECYGPLGSELLIDTHVVELLEKGAIYQVEDK